MEISIELWNAILKMFIILVVLTALFLIVHFGLRRLSHKKNIRTGKIPIEILYSRYIGAKKSISMVKIPGKILVIGITPDRITLLSKIQKAEFVESICIDKPSSASPIYSSLFQKLNFNFLSKDR